MVKYYVRSENYFTNEKPRRALGVDDLHKAPFGVD